MSDYALMRKMHDALKQAHNEIEALKDDQPDGYVKEQLENISWDIQLVIREVEDR